MKVQKAYNPTLKSERLSVLVIAHELSPVIGSECAEGWNIVKRLAKYHDITVLYSSGSQSYPTSYYDAVNNYLNTYGPIQGLSFINIDQPNISKFIISVNSHFLKIGAVGLPILYYLGYKYWQKAAFKKSKQLHKREIFNIVHQLTQITFREPGYSYKLGIPFFWGPTGGIMTLPKSFQKLLSKKSLILEKIRTFSNFYQYNFSRRVIEANKSAAVIYAFSKEDALKLKKRATGKVKLMMDAAAQNHTDIPNKQKVDLSIIRGIWCGQLIERKAATILLQALSVSEITRNKIEFQIIGSGPCDRLLHEQAKILNLKNIKWIENVDHNTVFQLMSEADIFVHTSIREATSNVIPEALSMGLPVICHDAYGMSIAIDETCGIKIPFISPDESIKGFHDAIERLILDRSLLQELKKGAVKQASTISWDKMAEEISNDYLEIINNTLSESKHSIS